MKTKILVAVILGTVIMSLFPFRHVYADDLLQQIWTKDALRFPASKWMPYYPGNEITPEQADQILPEERYKFLLVETAYDYVNGVCVPVDSVSYSFYTSTDPFTVFYNKWKSSNTLEEIYDITIAGSKNDQKINVFGITDTTIVPSQFFNPVVDMTGTRLAFNNRCSRWSYLDINETNPQSYKGFNIGDVTDNSFNLTWNITDTSVSKVQVRLLSTFDPDFKGPEGQVFKYDVSDGSAVISGLKPNTNYYMEITTINQRGINSKDELGINGVNILYLITLKTSHNLQLDMGGKKLHPSSIEYFNPLQDLTITTTDYTRVKVFAGHDSEEIIDKTGLSKNNMFTIPGTELHGLPAAPNGLFKIKVWAYKESGVYDQYEYNISTQLDPSGGKFDDDLFRPKPPERPESSWDIVGWLEYIVDWIVYIVRSFTWLLGKLGDSINVVFSGLERLSPMISSIFSFLPAPILSLIMLAITTGVIASLVRR